MTPKASRILIWGKTAPELSTKYTETVCTAGVLEDGKPVRLYPIPFRYLTAGFSRYQWIEALIRKSENDHRPESYKIEKNSIKLCEKIRPTSDEWGKRREIIFKNPAWQFESVEHLREEQATKGTSLALIRPKEIMDIRAIERSEDEAKNFEEKLARVRADIKVKRYQLNLFEQTIPAELKHIDFQRHRISVRWRCFGSDCNVHDMQVLDWEIAELQRKEGVSAALQKMREICNLAAYDLYFYLGNMFLHPTAFLIVGLWYPKRAPGRLF